MRPRIVFLLPFLVSCDTADALLHASPGPSGGEPLFSREALRGTAGIQTTESGDVVLWLDGGASGETPDGIADRVFVVQRLGPVEVVETAWFDDAEIISAPREVTVRAGARLVARLVVATTGVASPFPEDRAGLSVAGHGLSRRTGRWQLREGRLAAAELRDVDASCGGGARMPSLQAAFAADCTSGGEGSLSCTGSCVGGDACSVTCASGFYSCCNRLQCRCTCIAVEKGAHS